MHDCSSLACQLWGCGVIDYVTLAACVPATAIVAVWFLGRHTLWAWPLQDAMGVALIMLLLRQFRLPDIKVGQRAFLSLAPAGQMRLPKPAYQSSYYALRLQTPRQALCPRLAGKSRPDFSFSSQSGKAKHHCWHYILLG